VRREVDLLLGYRGRLPARLGQRPAEEQFNAANLLQQSPYTLRRRDPDGQNFRALLNPPPTHSLSFRLSLGSLGASGKRFSVRHRDAGSRLPSVGRR